MNNFVQVEFSLRGQTLPSDHGYALYSAIKKICSEKQVNLLNDSNLSSDTLLSTIPGVSDKNGKIYLHESSRLRLRCPEEQASQWYRLLQNQVLNIKGYSVRLIQPRLTLPQASNILKARLVVFKDTNNSLFYNPEAHVSFLSFCQRALERKEINGKAFIDSNKQGELDLKAIRIKDKNVLGYGVTIEGLNEQDSIKLQVSGLGGRKHFGCGWFYPVKGCSHAA
jgi:CRISPR-associated protein Cas6